MDSARVIAVVASALVGAFVALGCLLAALFELQGFGTPRDAEPRAGYLVALALGLGASVGVPLALWRILLPESSPAAGVVIAATAVVVAVAVLGLGLSR